MHPTEFEFEEVFEGRELIYEPIGQETNELMEFLGQDKGYLREKKYEEISYWLEKIGHNVKTTRNYTKKDYCVEL